MRVASARGFVHRAGNPVGRLPQAEPMQKLLEFLAIFGVVDRIDAGADDRHAGAGQRPGQIQRRLSAELHDHAVGLHTIANVEHIFDRQRLEEQQIAGVVIGADRFGIRIDHHAFDAQLAQAQSWRGSSSSRTQSPGRCDSARRRESQSACRRPAWRALRLRSSYVE